MENQLSFTSKVHWVEESGLKENDFYGVLEKETSGHYKVWNV